MPRMQLSLVARLSVLDIGHLQGPEIVGLPD
jgi:hypothetical protein